MKIYSEHNTKEVVLADRWFVDHKTLRKWGRFRRFEESQDDLQRLPSGTVPCFISHRWLTRHDPDPNREQYELVIQNLMGDEFFWYDYSCMPQSDIEGHDIQTVLDTLHIQVKASKLLVLRTLDDDYFQRGWCFHEWFTAQYMGSEDREFLNYDDPRTFHRRDDYWKQIVEAKHFADRIISGNFALLDNLNFSDERDQVLVIESARNAVKMIQIAIVERLFNPLFASLEDYPYEMPSMLVIDYASSKFSLVAEFIQHWARFLQIVEPVSSRVAVFLSRSHADAFLQLTRPDVIMSMISYMYSKRLDIKGRSEAELQLRKCFEYCERRFPKPPYVVVAFLCQTLLR